MISLLCKILLALACLAALITLTVQEEEKERVREMSRLFPVENRGKKRRQLLRTSKTSE